MDSYFRSFAAYIKTAELEETLRDFTLLYIGISMISSAIDNIFDSMPCPSLPKTKAKFSGNV